MLGHRSQADDADLSDYMRIVFFVRPGDQPTRRREPGGALAGPVRTLRTTEMIGDPAARILPGLATAVTPFGWNKKALSEDSARGPAATRKPRPAAGKCSLASCDGFRV
jgi:hypothetical protein